MSIENNPGYKAVIQGRSIPNSPSYTERQEIAKGVATANSQKS